jgi:predicted ArsR family transcriptional regulator
MHANRFFSTTRGRIVTELRRRNSASAGDLAASLALSSNAVRQQLVVLERDGFVEEKPVRRGPTKPTLEFSLTDRAAELFPQSHGRMLSAVLREVREQFGPPAVDQIFDGLSERAVERARRRVTATSVEGRVAQLTDLLREEGVVAEYTPIEGGFAIHEHTCPYTGVAREHPQMCRVIHRVIDETVGCSPDQTESLARGDKECCFEIKLPS